MFKRYSKKLLLNLYQTFSYFQIMLFKNRTIIVGDSHGRLLFSLKNSSNKLLLYKAQPTLKINFILFWVNLTSYKFYSIEFTEWIYKIISKYKANNLVISCGEIDIRYYANLDSTENIKIVANKFCDKIIELSKIHNLNIFYIIPIAPCRKLSKKKEKGRIPFEGTYYQRLESFKKYKKIILNRLNNFASIKIIDLNFQCNEKHCEHDKDYIHFKDSHRLKILEKFN
tara:strand:- start:327 stop:1007 length:681 start_codon:yes stop_codon:yes gene_type:complete